MLTAPNKEAESKSRVTSVNGKLSLAVPPAKFLTSKLASRVPAESVYLLREVDGNTTTVVIEVDGTETVVVVDHVNHTVTVA